MNGNLWSLFILAILLVSVFLLSIKFEFPFVFRPPQIRQYANLDAYKEESLKDGAISSIAIDPYLQAFAPSINDPERKFELVPYGNIGTYVRDDNDKLGVEQICVDSISLLVNTQDTPHQFLNEPLCHIYDNNEWF